MRTRTRTVALQSYITAGGPCNITFNPCGGAGAPAPNTVGVTTFCPEILDETITDALGRGKSHKCVHTKTKKTAFSGGYPYMYGGQSNGVPGVYYYSNRDSGSNMDHYSTYSNWLNHDYIVETLSGNIGNIGRGWTTVNLTSLQEASLRNDVIEKARGLKADVLLNLIEAHQIIPSVKSLTGCLPQMAANWRRIRTVLKTASGAFLAWKFGVSPILSDMVSITKYLRNASDKFKRHANGDAIRYSKYAELVTGFMGEKPNETVVNNEVVWHFEHGGRCLRVPTVRYVLVAKPKATYKTELFQKLDLALSRFASSPAELAWELIPFSFVLDWFVDLRSALNAVDFSLRAMPFEIVSFTRSYGYHLINETSVTRKSPCNGATLYDGPMGSTEMKYYERSIVSDQVLLPGWMPKFGKNQAAISVALITQALNKR